MALAVCGADWSVEKAGTGGGGVTDGLTVPVLPAVTGPVSGADCNWSGWVAVGAAEAESLGAGAVEGTGCSCSG